MAGHQHEPITVQNTENSYTVFHQSNKGLINKLERSHIVKNFGFKNDCGTKNNILGTKLNQPKKGTVHFKLFHQNIRGLGNKAEELLSHLHPDFPHVLCLTEHHLKKTQLGRFYIENYKLGAHYCREKREKGGVAIFVHNSLASTNIDIVRHCKDQDIEICAVKLSFGALNICVVTLYRAPSGNFSTFLLKLDTILQSIYSPKLHLIICGDININYLKESEIKSKLDSLLLSYNLTSTINFPTRVQNATATAIDNIFIDVSQLESYTVTPIINGMSDHDAQLLMIGTNFSHAPLHKIKTIRKINKHTIFDFLNKLSCESWNAIFKSEDVNDMYNSFLNTYLRIFYSSFPLKKVTDRNKNDNNNWITTGIKTSCRHKRKLYLACRNSNNQESKRSYQVYCKILSNVIKEAKRIHYNKTIKNSTNKCKTTWNIIKKLTNNQQTQTDVQELMIDTRHLIDQQDITDAFSTYFSTVIDKININNINNKTDNFPTFHHYVEQNYSYPPPPLVIKTFSTKEITSIIKLLKTKNSYGYDEISTKVLKLSATYICSPLTYICNKSILTGKFPDRMKFSVVKPIYKKGDKKNPANYRPISLLTSFSKVFEKALYTRLTDHLSTYKLLVTNQFGFRKGIATEDAIFKLTNEILTALNSKKVIGGIFCDLEKAFDSVNHGILLSKLPYYGISGKAKLLLESYMQNRYQRVQIANSYLNTTTTSKWTKIKSGVPQGSILGPLLFLIYINDLPRAVEHKALPIIFADDTSILLASPNNSQMQTDLNEVFAQLNKWFKSNMLLLNFDKTSFVQFTNKTTSNLDMQIKHEDKQIRSAMETKFLGLFINNKLSWKTHIECIKSKLSSACYAMRTIKPYVAANTLKTIYYSYFHSIMTYGLLFWGNSPDSIKIFRLQKKIIRIMMGCKNTESCKKLFLNLKILPLPSQYILSLLLFVIRNKNQFPVNSTIYHFDTRQHENFHQPSVNVTKFQKGVSNLGAKVFNMLPSHIKIESDNPKKFKLVLQKFLYKNSFYSLDEYFQSQKMKN